MSLPIQPETWRVDRYHGRPGFREWRLTESGVDRNGIHRSKNKIASTLAPKVWEQYKEAVSDAAEIFKVSKALIVATICTESAGNPNAERFEPGLDDWSLGLTQHLSITADYLGNHMKWPRADGHRWAMPRQSIPTGGSVDHWRMFLSQPFNSIELCAGLHALNNERLGLRGDPILAYLAYNAGGIYESDDNAWGLRYFSVALDAMELYLNDAASVIGTVF